MSAGVSFASSFNVYDFQSLASITKTEKHSTSGVRNLETKDKSPQPNKRKVALEARQENFEGLKPFEVKLKMISLNQCAKKLMLREAKELERELEAVKQQVVQDMKEEG
ncbi:uncharacterized protein LOC111878258 [Lactuca sativa]|uniref:uncharacterized protein LOC111878258 n=1 Tax=Lactuca sativa TaxID=4236 RepID=UPI0022AF059F|nr:uncharacterized protein LOC111878258 [Lactuca sativa]